MFLIDKQYIKHSIPKLEIYEIAVVIEFLVDAYYFALAYVDKGCHNNYLPFSKEFKFNLYLIWNVPL